MPRELPPGMTDEMFWGLCDCDVNHPGLKAEVSRTL